MRELDRRKLVVGADLVSGAVGSGLMYAARGLGALTWPLLFVSSRMRYAVGSPAPT